MACAEELGAGGAFVLAHLLADVASRSPILERIELQHVRGADS